MKLKETFFILVILFVSLQVCLAQKALKAELVDEFSSVTCDDFRYRIDSFLFQLVKNPDLRGYVYITGKEDDLRKKARYELLIKGQIAFRNFDERRVSFIRNTDTENFKVQLWNVPTEAEIPDFKEANWNFVFPPQTKPFLFHDDFEGENYCPQIQFETVYVEYLNANPQARGHIVIYVKSIKKYNKFKTEVLNLLKDIPITRLKFFHVKKQHSDNHSNVEYWLVP